jgi:hypothetical protein
MDGLLALREAWRNKACAMAGDELVDTCCVASGTIAAESATRASANAAVKMDRRIVAIRRYAKGASAKLLLV